MFQVWLLCPADDGNLGIWFPDYICRDGTATKVFIEESENLLVVVATKPHIMVLPPHCFHSVLTITMACHIGIRTGSTLWYDEMEVVVRCWTSRKNIASVLEKSDRDVNIFMEELIEDTRMWMDWFNSIERKATEKEMRFMKLLVKVEKPLKKFKAHLVAE